MTLAIKMPNEAFTKTVGGVCLLDTYAGASIALSLRRLKGSFNTAALRMRKSSNSAEQDFRFAGIALNAAEIATFLGADDGYVRTIYDQSGNAYNAAQVTTANQPKVATAGALITVNSKAAIQADGSNDTMTFTAQALKSCFLVGKLDAITNTYQFLVGGANQGFDWGGSSGVGIEAFQVGPGFISSTVKDTTTMHLGSFVVAGSTLSLYVDSVLKATGAISALTVDTLFGRSDIGTTCFPGKFQEFIGFTTDQTANRAAIEANMKAYWGTP